jgi:uncharacterized protein YecE (DUF72 family)
VYHLAMTEELMVGTFGWDYPEWVGPYYPDDLPDDWRFGYYSNDFRSVLVPAGHFRGDDASISDWAEDCDESFRLVIEIPGALLTKDGSAALAEFMLQLGPLSQRVAGCFVDLTELSTAESLAEPLELIARYAPLCLKLPPTVAPEIAALAKRVRAGICWLPEVTPAPAPGGRLVLALTDSSDPKAQRHMIESLEEWMQQSGGIAGLFFTGGARAARAASQARVIAEMLGI